MPRKRRPPVKGLPRLARPMTLVGQTEQLLREALARGRFPGNRLPTSVELADQLGVSRETVRLAQEALQREGLLVKYRRKGTLIQPPAMSLKGPAVRSTGIAYLQTDYPSAEGHHEEVTRSLSGLMLQGATREAGRAGFELVVRHAPHTEMDRALEELTRSMRPRGVIFASFGEEKLVRQALGQGLPTVLLDHDLNLPRIGSVREDSFQGAHLAVEHLAGLGHRRIAYAQWHLTDLNPWRLRGYRQGLRDAGLPRRRAWELFTELTESGARRLVQSLLELRPAPTALICFNNTLARLVIEDLHRKGLRVPQDLSVMGAGGETVPQLSGPQADWFGMGRAAVRILLSQINSRKPGAPEHQLFPYTLKAGKTAAALAR